MFWVEYRNLSNKDKDKIFFGKRAQSCSKNTVSDHVSACDVLIT